MRYLEADPRRVQLAQARDDVGRASTGGPERDAGMLAEVVLGDAVELRRQLRRPQAACRAGRAERRGGRSCGSHRRACRRGDVAQKAGIGLSGEERLAGDGGGTAQTLRESEELPPRFVDGGGIFQVRFVRFAYVPSLNTPVIGLELIL